MANSIPKPKTGFDRCAVCKIDLKGRFVYVDERIEALLGQSKDELFGRSITGFVDSRTASLIASLLEERNHYETFYEHARFTIVNARGEPANVHAVVSLNFIAGNPANFQMIFRALMADENPAPSATDFTYRDLIDGLLRSDGLSDMREFLRVLVNCCGATAGYAYQIEGDMLVPRSGASLGGDSEFKFDSIPEPKKLHQLVAQSGVPYSYTDQSKVTEAIEKDGDAPCEYVARVNVGEQPRYIIRLAFAQETPMEKADEAVARADVAIQLATRIADQSETINDDDPDVDVKFTVGFLDTLNIGAMVTSETGDIVGYNSTASRLLEGRRPEGKVDEVLETLLDKQGKSIRAEVQKYFDVEDHKQEELVIEVKSAAGPLVQMTVVRLSLQSNDRTAFFVFQTDENNTVEG